MDISAALAVAPAVVLVITELLKYVPVAFTTKYPAWVNGIVSVVAAFVVVKPDFNWHDAAALAGTALYVAVVAAIAYNQYASHLKKQ